MANNIGIINKPYVSSVALVDEREIYNQLIDRQNDAEWIDFLYQSGRREVAVIPHFDSFFNDPKFIVISTTGATVTGSGTTAVTVTNLQSPYNNYVKVGDTILLPNLGVARVQTVSTTTITNDTFTTLSVDGANLTLVAGNNITVNGSAQEEASLSPASMRFNETAIRNSIQIMSESWEVTDVQKGSWRTFEVGGSYKVMPQASLDLLQLMRGRMAATHWSGLASATLFEDSSPALTGVQGNAVQTTRGIDSYVRTYGITPSVLTPGTVTLADLTDLEDRLTAVKAPSEYMLAGGRSPVAIVSNFVKNLNSSGAQSVRLMGNGKETDFEATQFSHGGYTFYLKAFNLLSNPQIFNYDATGSGSKLSLATSLYAMPYGKCPIYGGTDGNGGTTDYFRYRYMDMYPNGGGGGNVTSKGEITEILSGALAPTPTNDTMYLKGRMIVNSGLEMFKPQVFAKWGVQ